MLFTSGKIGTLSLKNRTVRSATADTDILAAGEVTRSSLYRYEKLAQNEAGLIITGDFPVINSELLISMAAGGDYDYGKIRIKNLSRLPDAVHGSSNTPIAAQISTDLILRIPSRYDSPFKLDDFHIINRDEIEAVISCFVLTAQKMEEEGFDGVQLHAAHGGFLSQFLSPFCNRREDEWGGSAENNTRMVKEIIGRIKTKNPDFPVLVKINSSDFLPGGLGEDNLQTYASLLEQAGADALEFSGGTWDALCRPEEELGFTPVPACESRINLNREEDQSYYRTFTAPLKLGIPRILVGGNKSYNVVEDILRKGEAELISFCRPFIHEPDFLSRWKSGDRAPSRCISCNACIYDMWFHPCSEEERETYCLYNKAKEGGPWKEAYAHALAWRDGWVEENRGK